LSFPFEKRWLRGEEYGFLCRHYYAYSEVFKIFKVIDGNHPEEIYHEPKCKYNFESLFLQTVNFISSKACIFNFLDFQEDPKISKDSTKPASTKNSNGRRQILKHAYQSTIQL
jgi:hypothetical protein